VGGNSFCIPLCCFGVDGRDWGPSFLPRGREKNGAPSLLSGAWVSALLGRKEEDGVWALSLLKKKEEDGFWHPCLLSGREEDGFWDPCLLSGREDDGFWDPCLLSGREDGVRFLYLL